MVTISVFVPSFVVVNTWAEAIVVVCDVDNAGEMDDADCRQCCRMEFTVLPLPPCCKGHERREVEVVRDVDCHCRSR